MEMPSLKVNITTYLGRLHAVSIFQLNGSLCFFPSEDIFFYFEQKEFSVICVKEKSVMIGLFTLFEEAGSIMFIVWFML